jgi:hypothetical protein
MCMYLGAAVIISKIFILLQIATEMQLFSMYNSWYFLVWIFSCWNKAHYFVFNALMKHGLINFVKNVHSFLIILGFFSLNMGRCFLEIAEYSYLTADVPCGNFVL